MRDFKARAVIRAGQVARRIAKIPPGAAFDPDVRAAIAQIRAHTMVADEGLVTLYQQVQHLERIKLPGAFVECGVWHGGSVGLVALANLANSKQPRHLHLFDSFRGIPEPVAGLDGARAVADVGGRSKAEVGDDLRVAWDYAERGGPGSANDVVRLFSRLDYPWREYLHIHEGWFQETVPLAVNDMGPIALLRLDGDWYESTKVCLDHLYDLVQPGGFVIIDDYGAYDGCRLAVDQFLDQLPQRPFLNPVNHEIHYLIKPS